MKALCTSRKGLRWTAVSDKMPPSLRLALMAQEGTMQASEGGKQAIVLPIYDDCVPQQWPWAGNPKGTIVACLHALVVANM